MGKYEGGSVQALHSLKTWLSLEERSPSLLGKAMPWTDERVLVPCLHFIQSWPNIFFKN